MDPTKLVITYSGKWVGNFYEGSETEFVKVCRNLTYSELSRVVQGVANVDLTRFSIELRTLVDTGVRLRPARPKIKDDSDVKMLLCDGGHVPEVFELVRTEDSSSCNRLSKGRMFESKKSLKLALQGYTLKENFEIRVTRSYTGRYEVGCKDPEFSGRSLKPKEIMTDMQVKHLLSLMYTKALRAKGLDEQNVFGSPDLSYQLLPAYCHELKRVNHGTELKKAIGCPTNCIIISDRSPAIKVAMAKEYPEIPYGLCGFHMNMNLKNRFKSHVVCNLFHEASRAHRQTEFLEKMRELSRVNMGAYEYLMRVGPHKWSRAYCPVRRYGGG
ncbi:hypothetical protein Ddye_026457 [Dipteronia dyeriana]|uniref:Transposase n=1 Tax=Dipteronia dyeriana TaxID=168575 RepID=A0AAD9TM83_9ROSI|nr:hypothetical protein Ddye_026457 [Dipteronia dyeriana]